MSLTASISTGSLEDTRKAASGITEELRQQVSLLERAQSLDAKVGRGSRGPRAPSAGVEPMGPPVPFFLNGPPRPAFGGDAFQTQQAKSNFRRMFDGEVKNYRKRAEFEGRMGSAREFGRSIHGTAQLVQGQVSVGNVRDVLELGEYGLAGSRAARFSRAALGALSEAAPAIMLMGAGIADIQSSFDMANRAGARSRLFDKMLTKTFSRLDDPGLKDLRDGITRNTMRPVNGNMENFDTTVEASAERKERRLEMLSGIMANPLQGSAAFHALHPWIRRVSPNLSSIQREILGHESEGRTLVTNTVATLLNAVKAQAQKQSRVFDENPQAASQYHEEVRTHQQLERWKYEQRQKDWGKN